jgi:hypothetical protein
LVKTGDNSMLHYPYPHAGRFIRMRSTPRFNYFAGWQYLFQPGYRQEIHERWREESKISIILQILGSIFGMGLTGVLAALAFMAAMTLV